MSSAAFTPLPRGRTASSIADILRHDIVALKLKPGDALSRQEIQHRFRVSSTPVRDALGSLQEEGLVDIFPQHGTFVSPIDVARARRALFLRRALELELVHTLALDHDALLIAKLRAHLSQQEAVESIGQYHEFTLLDRDFHRIFYETADVMDLWHLVQRQSGHLDRLRRLLLPMKGKVRQILDDHKLIVEMIETGDANGARLTLREHLRHSLDFLATLQEQFPAYFRWVE